MHDPALDTLMLALELEAVAPGEDHTVAFFRARADRALAQMNCKSLICEQSFAPERDRLVAMGYTVDAEIPVRETFDRVLVMPTRQRQETRAELARAVLATREGGIVVACAANSEGAKTVEADLKALLGPVDTLIKNKCRAIWAPKLADSINQDLLTAWAALDEKREVLDGAFVSRPGVFAWDRVDPASALLIEHMPNTLAGRGADLGCGFGVLSRAALEKAPKIASLDLYEAERRALDLAEENLASWKGKKPLVGIWSDVTKGVDGPYDFIIMNPPFHQSGKADRTDVGQGFIRAASSGLRGGGQLFLVANRHLPYEQTLRETFKVVEMLADEGGYKVIRAIKATGKITGQVLSKTAGK
ncbi:class I SAM-dependent methyltransferase [Roseibium limicola]|uniref:Class I SAM-dependent methyltransferase n=1 Tax=Roseibium limicola TaxID=2816037 RepID=A0A939EMC4_9HYPH|nr:class I SAM-dependent methyltransferase [Roseibium limicola]MBO0345355.1 class I SAM-dependent methyltransferase [Roseibium limicola]